MNLSHRRRAFATVLACAVVVSGTASTASQAGDRAAVQTTELLSRNLAGEVPNGPSGNSVISGDKRYARVIAYESDASDLVPGDSNGQRDVFAVLRSGRFFNDGSSWIPGPTVLVSRTESGQPADGPSFAASVDGSFANADDVEPSCVGFLSAATNIVSGDTNGTVDAFVAPIASGAPKRISPEVRANTTAVAVSGDCSLIAMVTGDRLYLYDGKMTRLIATDGVAGNPSFGVGRNQDLVFDTPAGVWLLAEGSSTPKLVAPGGRNPAYNDVKRQVVAYEKPRNGIAQVFFRDLGEKEKLASGRRGQLGDGGSRKPVIGNSGFALAFETDASNLGVNALSRVGDTNGQTDVYLYTDVRELTLVQSVQKKAVPLPGGGRNPGMSFYNNYITFDSPAPLGAESGPSQVFMRYLGGETADSGTGAGIDDLPDPTVGKEANVGPVSGVVLIRLPSRSKAREFGFGSSASGRFVRLTRARQIPLGSTMDTTRGRVELETAVGLSKPGQTQTGQFYSGMFAVRQVGGRRRPTTEMRLNGALQCRSGSNGKIRSAARRSRRLWGNGRGRFRTRGRNSSATVRGTEWLQKDSCGTTTTLVRQGTVVVRDFAKRKNITVRAGQRYVARPRGR